MAVSRQTASKQLLLFVFVLYYLPGDLLLSPTIVGTSRVFFWIFGVVEFFLVIVDFSAVSPPGEPFCPAGVAILPPVGVDLFCDELLSFDLWDDPL